MMTITKFAKRFNLSSEDMLEVFKCMKYLKPDYSDWIDELYNENIVADLDDIVDYKRLYNDVEDYKRSLKLFYKSRNGHNEDIGFSKMIIKNNISRNKAILNFISN